MSPAVPKTSDAAQSEEVLRQLRIPFIRRATLARKSGTEDAFLIDIGLSGAFIERREALPVGEQLEIHLAWPGSEVPFRATCRVAWSHSEGAPLSSKALPPGVGLEFVDMSETDRKRLRSLLDEYCAQDAPVRRFLRHWPDAERHSDDP
jgi:Tfp pilus assembly protein PilZ